MGRRNAAPGDHRSTARCAAAGRASAPAGQSVLHYSRRISSVDLRDAHARHARGGQRAPRRPLLFPRRVAAAAGGPQDPRNRAQSPPHSERRAGSRRLRLGVPRQQLHPGAHPGALPRRQAIQLLHRTLAACLCLCVSVYLCLYLCPCLVCVSLCVSHRSRHRRVACKRPARTTAASASNYTSPPK